MSLSQSVDYDKINIPHKTALLSQVDKIKKELEELAREYTGFSVVIPASNLPLWYYLLLFKALSGECQEIVYEINKEKEILLYTLYKKEDNYVRPLSIIMNNTIINFSEKPKERQIFEFNFDLNTLDKYDVDNIDELIEYIEKQSAVCNELSLCGKTEIFKGLIAYIILNKFSNATSYQIDNKIVNI